MTPHDLVMIFLIGAMATSGLVWFVTFILIVASIRAEDEYAQWQRGMVEAIRRADFGESDRICIVGPRQYAIEVANGGAAAIAVERNACSIGELDSEINDPLVEGIATKYGRAAA